MSSLFFVLGMTFLIWPAIHYLFFGFDDFEEHETIIFFVGSMTMGVLVLYYNFPRKKVIKYKDGNV